jgi:hypothetical protein
VYARESWEYVDRLAATRCQEGGTIEDRLLLVAARFDDLSGLPFSLLDDLGRSLIPSGAGEADLLRRPEFSLVTEFVRAANTRLKRDLAGRLAFVSPLVTIGRAKETGQQWPVDQVKGRLQVGPKVEEALGRADAWSRVNLPPGAVGVAVRAFVKDGGIERLREIVVRYVMDNGVAQHLRDMSAEADSVVNAANRLARESADARAAGRASYAEARRLRKAKADLASGCERIRAAVVKEFGDPRRRTDEDTPSLAEILEAEGTFRVHGWSQWRRLFDRVQREDGRVVVQGNREEQRPRPVPGLPPGRPTAAAPVVMAVDFQGAFVRDAQEIQQRAFDWALGALQAWLEASVARFELREAEREMRQILGAVPSRRDLADGGPGAGKSEAGQRDAAGVLDMVAAMCDPNRVVDWVRGELEAGLPAITESGIRQWFPFDETRSLPWHPESPRRGQPATAGLVQVLRLRRELVNALIAAGADRLGDLQALARSKIGEVYEMYSEALHGIEDDELTHYARTAAGDYQPNQLLPPGEGAWT